MALSATRLAVIGDFHLGRPGAELACTVPTHELVAAARVLAESHDLVVVNGDLFDLERGVIPFAFRRELALLEQQHAPAVAAMDGPPFVWVRGNHDHVLASLGRALMHVDVSLPFGTLRIEHGDRFNAPIKSWAPFTSAITWMSGRVLGVPPLRPIFELMRHADLVLTGASTKAECPIGGAAVRWCEARPEYVGIVIGHTHAPTLERSRDRWLMNPGGSTDAVHALSIDGTTAVAELRGWRDGGFETTHRERLA